MTSLTSSTFSTTDPTNSTNIPTTTTDSPTTPTTTSDVPTTTSDPSPLPPVTTSSTITDSITTSTTTQSATTQSTTTQSTTLFTIASTIDSTTVVTTDVTRPIAPTGSTSPSTMVTIVTSITNPPVSTNPTTSSTETTTTASPTIRPSSIPGGGGLGSSGTIAIAVIIPVVVVALLLVLGFFLWRKREARKAAEEQRKDEMAEYGFNPNNDPSLAPVAGAYTDGHSEAADDNSGYRGWGTTNSNVRNPSTTLGSNSRAGAMGMGMSESSSQPGGYAYSAPPTNGTAEAYPSDPLMSGDAHIEGVAALGAAGRTNRTSPVEIQRGISNASSSYSNGGPRSEMSAEVPYGSPPYHEDTTYHAYNDGNTSHGPYGDGTYANDQPVIRDVSARRNTKIERAPTFPQTQGGISQNF